MRQKNESVGRWAAGLFLGPWLLSAFAGGAPKKRGYPSMSHQDTAKKWPFFSGTLRFDSRDGRSPSFGSFWAVFDFAPLALGYLQHFSRVLAALSAKRNSGGLVRN